MVWQADFLGLALHQEGEVVVEGPLLSQIQAWEEEEEVEVVVVGPA